MKLNVSQIAILERINNKLVRGDIREIVFSVGLSRVTVSNALNVNVDSFNQDIVTAAINLITAREQATKNNLKLLNAN